MKINAIGSAMKNFERHVTRFRPIIFQVCGWVYCELALFLLQLKDMILNSHCARLCMALGTHRRAFRLFTLSFCHLTECRNHVSNTICSPRRQISDLNTVQSYTSEAAQQNLFCERLEHRGLIRISGVDTLKFLQGLVTNDVRLLEKVPVIYAMMLNVQGRVMDDLIIYGTQSTTSVIVECNRNRCLELINTLSRYKMRNKVQLLDATDELDCWSLFGDSVSNLPSPESLMKGTSHNITTCVSDPRLPTLGSRLLLPRGVTALSVVGGLVASVTNSYRRHLCRVGIGEGIVDFPPGQCFPLESNLAFLNGVSFDKGCYIGQELTARTHHTGVIRKRILPLALSNSSQQVKPGASIINGAGKVCGKVRTVCGNDALGLLRVADVLGDASLRVKIDDTVIAEARTCIPSWWPSQIDAVLLQTMSKDNN